MLKMLKGIKDNLPMLIEILIVGIAPAISLILHEIGHYLTSVIIYGVGGRITFFQYGVAGCFCPNGDIGYLAWFGGGIFSGLCLVGYYFILKRYLTIIGEAGIICVSVAQISYGFMEGFHIETNTSTIISLVCATLSIFIFLVLIRIPKPSNTSKFKI
jgi:hypothetical protein